MSHSLQRGSIQSARAKTTNCKSATNRISSWSDEIHLYMLKPERDPHPHRSQQACWVNIKLCLLFQFIVVFPCWRETESSVAVLNKTEHSEKCDLFGASQGFIPPSSFSTSATVNLEMHASYSWYTVEAEQVLFNLHRFPSGSEAHVFNAAESVGR